MNRRVNIAALFLQKLGATRLALLGFVAAIAVFATPPAAWAQELKEDCTASVLNRASQVNPDGSFLIRNVPVEPGFFRVRVNCNQGGTTFGGESNFVVLSEMQLSRQQRSTHL